jgi:exopolyphosphatase / guanosine-5'-triphosphate,3'-diphosphate pyrophosphatase
MRSSFRLFIDLDIMQNGTLLAAIDLGSNSFRLEIGRFDHGHIRRTEYLKETVRLGSGLDENRNLTQEAMGRGWDCLARFGERLANFDPALVRAAATQTLREARNRETFLARAQELLGYPIQVISGHEEARLIYQGVAHLLPQSTERRLIVDIGGRSTELVLGKGIAPTQMASYRLGSVVWSLKYFHDGQLTVDAFTKASIAAKAILDDAIVTYEKGQWDTAYGSSGTIGAIAEILTSQGFEANQVTLNGVYWLREALIKSKHVNKLQLEGLREDRRAIIGGGISIAIAVMELLGIDRLHAAQGALRHGLLFELSEPEKEHRDLRYASVARLAKSFQANPQQAQRVSIFSQALFQGANAALGLDQAALTEHLEALDLAAQLHEIGFQISHSDYHKHGAYIVDNADLDGFSMPELHRLSLLVLGHRGKLKKVEAALDSAPFALQLLCFRLASILCHARTDLPSLALDLSLVSVKRREFRITVPADLSERRPQSNHLIQQEVLAWAKTRWNIEIRSHELKELLNTN